MFTDWLGLQPVFLDDQGEICSFSFGANKVTKQRACLPSGKITFLQTRVGHQYVLDSDGKVWKGSPEFSRLKGFPEMKQISLGRNHLVGVDVHGLLWGFGENQEGQLGTGNLTTYDEPVQIRPDSLPRMSMVSCSTDATYCLDVRGRVWMFGLTHSMFLTVGSHPVELKIPVNLPEMCFISAGGQFCLMLDVRGNIWGCGRNNYGQYGAAGASEEMYPIRIHNLPKIIQIAAGQVESVILDEHHRPWASGYLLHTSHFTQINVENVIHVSIIQGAIMIVDDQHHVFSYTKLIEDANQSVFQCNVPNTITVPSVLHGLPGKSAKSARNA